MTEIDCQQQKEGKQMSIREVKVYLICNPEILLSFFSVRLFIWLSRGMNKILIEAEIDS